jgi:hypothetical protein
VRENERFSDVCGAIDELKRSLSEEPGASADEPGGLIDLVGQTLRMEARMEARLAEYLTFRDEVARIARALDAVPGSGREEALAAAPELVRLLGLGRPLSPEERARAEGLAETIRRAAADLERSLYACKDAALALARAYREVKGSRTWVLDEREARALADASNQAPWARWLPHSPHRERIMRFIAAGRAHVRETDDPGVPPRVEFEDGGSMPLPDVRWSEDIRNFHLADSPPHPNGLRYRE